MKTKKQIAQQYISLLEKGDVEKVIALFSTKGMVQSPLYGLQSARNFYKRLSEDTTASKLAVKGIFEDANSGHLALYFNYLWTLKNGEQVSFDVVDILEFDDLLKIDQLTIIYDTVQSTGALKRQV